MDSASGKLEIPTKETIRMRAFLSSTDPPPFLAQEFYKKHEGFYNWLIEHPDVLNGTREEIDAAKVKYDAMRAKKKKRNKKRKERAKRNKKKKETFVETPKRPSVSVEMFGTCGWWRLREDHPLQLIANSFAKEHSTSIFPLHVTYSYGNDDFNHAFNNQYADPPWFDPMDMKNKVWQSPGDRWEWYTAKEDGEFIVDFDFSVFQKENCLFHSINIPVFLYDKCEMGPEPCCDGPGFYKYHISLAYSVVDTAEECHDNTPYGFITSGDSYLQWFREALNNKKIILRNDDFTAELWNCSSKNVEEWIKL